MLISVPTDAPKQEGIIWQCKWLWVINVGLRVKRLPSVSGTGVSHTEVLEVTSKLVFFFCCMLQGAFPHSETGNEAPECGLRLWPWRFGSFSPGSCEPSVLLLRKLVLNHCSCLWEGNLHVLQGQLDLLEGGIQGAAMGERQTEKSHSRILGVQHF